MVDIKILKTDVNWLKGVNINAPFFKHIYPTNAIIRRISTILKPLFFWLVNNIYGMASSKKIEKPDGFITEIVFFPFVDGDATRWEMVIKCSASLAFYTFSSTRLINSITQGHSNKIIYTHGKKLRNT